MHLVNKFNVGKYLESSNQHSRLFVVAISSFIFGFALCAPAYADMSVNGFFRSDYVKTGVFTDKASSSETIATEVIAASAEDITASKRVNQKPIRVRSYPGRFSKTTKGTNRHQVENNEWDVGEHASQ